jgi:hypothetical protein
MFEFTTFSWCPRHDSNVRTRLRSAFLPNAVTRDFPPCPHVLGGVWGAAPVSSWLPQSLHVFGIPRRRSMRRSLRPDAGSQRRGLPRCGRMPCLRTAVDNRAPARRVHPCERRPPEHSRTSGVVLGSVSSCCPEMRRSGHGTVLPVFTDTEAAPVCRRRPQRPGWPPALRGCHRQDRRCGPSGASSTSISGPAAMPCRPSSPGSG